MLFEHNIDNCFEEAIGPGGLSRADFQAVLDNTAPILASLHQRYDDRSLPFLHLAEQRLDLGPLAELAQDIKSRATDVVILGTGGSSLGAQAVTAIGDGTADGAPRLHFPDNLDGHEFAALLGRLDLHASFFVTISKSGGTAEVLAQTLVAMSACIDDGLELPRHFLFISQPADSPLRRLAKRWEIDTLDHDPGLGGRYAVLSLVGMLPALLLGMDAALVREGAQASLAQVLGAKAGDGVAPAEGAALSVALMGAKKLGIHVFMPFTDRLERLAMWYRQLWAESLGKEGRGSLPVRALGPVDQHSQLQLYLDGPADKFFTLMTLDSVGTGPEIDTGLAADPDLDYLTGRTIGDLVAAEARATAETLAAKGRPVRHIRLQRLDEAVLGALLMHFMLETVIAGGLLGVDPFDQPAVEAGKLLAKRTLEAQ